MDLNNFGDIVTLTKKRCNINDTTEFDDIITTAINGVYISLKKNEPEVASVFIPNINKVAQLPEDLDSIIRTDPILYADEYRLGSSLILQRDDNISVTYTAIPEPLENADKPLLSRKYWYLMSTYGCYAYYNFKKKLNEAQSYYNEYISQLGNTRTDDQTQVQIQDMYSYLLR